MLLILRQVARRLLTVAKENGLGAASRSAMMIVKRKLFVRRDAFDEEFRTDTARQESLWLLGIENPNLQFGVKYQATSAHTFAAGLEHISEDFANFVFVDLGCGKGRTLILADRAGFRLAVGVEFSAKLAETAIRNFGKVGTRRAGVVVGDAAEFPFPLEPLVVFLYNPFGAAVLQPVLENLRASLARHPRPTYLFYADPLHRNLVDDTGEFQVVGEGREPWFVVWKHARGSTVISTETTDSTLRAGG